MLSLPGDEAGLSSASGDGALGAVVSLMKEREAWVALLPAASEWLAVTVKAPSLREVTFKEADHAPEVQVTVVLSAPVAITTLRPFSEQVPVIAKFGAFWLLTTESCAGVENPTNGAVASYWYSTNAVEQLDTLPLGSVLLA